LQSNGQVLQFSPGAQTPSPQVLLHAPQSAAQVAQVSPASQMPLPHEAQAIPHCVAASFTQLESHLPPQQNGSMPHTVATQGSQVVGSGAPCSQSACEQVAQVPQSCGQVAQVSPSAASQTWLPQLGAQLVQSAGQVLQFSLPLHTPSPHTGQAPQSSGHDEQVSSGPLQARSPQTGCAQVLPQSASSAVWQAAVQLPRQHDGFCPQKLVSQARHVDAIGFSCAEPEGAAPPPQLLRRVSARTRT
jgi:hypothetical protein